MKPAVSIIIPAFNAAAYLKETVTSIQAQTMPDWEILIGDDGSTDKTAAIAEKLAENDDRISVFRFPASGLPSVARNRLLPKAFGQYVAFQDADDIWEPNKLEIQVGRLKGRLAWGFSNCRYFGGPDTNPDGFWYPAGWRPQKPFYPELLSTGGVPFISLIAHRDLLRRLHPDGLMEDIIDTSPEIRIGEDWDLELRLARLMEPIYFPEVLVRYRQHTSSITKSSDAMFHCCLNVIEKHRQLGADPEVCRRAERLQRSKIATYRMLNNLPEWRRMLLENTFPPLTTRDAVMSLISLAPRGLARWGYAKGIKQQRTQKE